MKSDFHFLARSLGPSSWFWCPASAFIRVTHALHPQLRSTWPLGAADGDPHPEQEPGFERNPTEQPMWLVKVPRYLSQPWSGASGSGQVGKLQMARDPGKSELFFTLQEELTGIQDAAGHPRPLRAPGEHPVLLRGGGGTRGQALAVRAEDAQDRLSLEGQWCSAWNADLPRVTAPGGGRECTESGLAAWSAPCRSRHMPGTTNYKPVANHPCTWNMRRKGKKMESEGGQRPGVNLALRCL